MTPANQLRQFRETHGLSLRDVASVSGLSRAMLSRVERGERQLSGLKKISLARALGVSIEEIFPLPREEEATPV